MCGLAKGDEVKGHEQYPERSGTGLSQCCLAEVGSISVHKPGHEEQAWTFPSLSCFLAASSHFHFHLSALINKCKKLKMCPLLMLLLGMENWDHVTGAQERTAACAHPAAHLHTKASSFLSWLSRGVPSTSSFMTTNTSSSSNLWQMGKHTSQS